MKIHDVIDEDPIIPESATDFEERPGGSIFGFSLRILLIALCVLVALAGAIWYWFYTMLTHAVATYPVQG